jgi:hypothetical protein
MSAFYAWDRNVVVVGKRKAVDVASRRRGDVASSGPS